MHKKIYICWEYQAIFWGGTSYTTFVLNIISPNNWKQFIDWYKSSPTYGTLKIFHKTHNTEGMDMSKAENHLNKPSGELRTRPFRKAKMLQRINFVDFY